MPNVNKLEKIHGKRIIYPSTKQTSTFEQKTVSTSDIGPKETVSSVHRHTNLNIQDSNIMHPDQTSEEEPIFGVITKISSNGRSEWRGSPPHVDRSLKPKQDWKPPCLENNFFRSPTSSMQDNKAKEELKLKISLRKQ